MAAKRRFLGLGLAAAFAVAGGTAWAVAQDDDPGPAGFAPTTGAPLAQGDAPSGVGYEVSRVDPADLGVDPTEAFCIEIRTPVAASQGCRLVSDADGRIAGQPWRPGMSLLGSDRFFSTLAPAGVTAMEVSIEGETGARRSQALDAGPHGKLLLAIVGGPPVTSRDPASSRDYEVRLLGANGETVQQATMRDPR